jgi:hypothetical protein
MKSAVDALLHLTTLKVNSTSTTWKVVNPIFPFVKSAGPSAVRIPTQASRGFRSYALRRHVYLMIVAAPILAVVLVGFDAMVNINRSSLDPFQ